MTRSLALSLLAVVATACARGPSPHVPGVVDADLGACPVALRGATMNTYDTDRGIAISLTGRDRAQVAQLRQAASRLAMEHTKRFDPIPDMEQRTVMTYHDTRADESVVVGQVPRQYTGQLDRIDHWSYATVVGVPGGVTIVIEPREDQDLGSVRQMGYSFANQLGQRCGLVG